MSSAIWRLFRLGLNVQMSIIVISWDNITHQYLLHIIPYEYPSWEKFWQQLIIYDEIFHQEGHHIVNDIAVFSFHLQRNLK